MIEVQHHQAVSALQKLVALVRFLVENKDVISTRHPRQETRKVIRDHYLDFVSKLTKELSKTQRGANGISIRIDMRNNGNSLR